MKERPILFSGEMVRAILDWRKTQTRRVVKPSKLVTMKGYYDSKWKIETHPSGNGWWATDGNFPDYAADERGFACPYGAHGDHLWVRETWTDEVDEENILYRADGEIDYGKGGRDKSSPRWKPSRFMPRKHARIFLEIVKVRVERLQEISAKDCYAEGVYYNVRMQLDEFMGTVITSSYPASAILAFHRGWDKINAKRSPWSSNPWVWVIEFKRVQPA